jgi:glycine cleavage system transcriptional repressor
MHHLILTAIGPDRPGLVDQISEYVFARAGNIEDSRMVNLRGRFAVMMLIGGESNALEKLRADGGLLAKETALAIELHDAPPAHKSGTAVAYRLTGTAIDQPGLVNRVAKLLRGMNVNIESLETMLRPAPYTGAPMFEMELILSVPQSTPVNQLRQSVATACDELNIDWKLDRA